MRPRHLLPSTALCLSLLLTGCALQQTAPSSPEAGVNLTGSVHGGQQPIVGAHVYLFAANTTGYGQPSVSLLNATTTGNSDSLGAYVATNSHGGFTITNDYACTPNTQVYLYALGGNPGAGVNSAAGLLAALGNCPSSGSFLASNPFIQVNEVTTIAAAYAIAGFATDATHVSSSGTPLAQTGIAHAFANATNLADITTGAALNVTPAGNADAPQTTVNTLANILASCINSTGPASTPCSTLLSTALPNGSSGTQPTDTATAAINIAHNPALNTATFFGLIPPGSPFQPMLSSAPDNFTVALFVSSLGPLLPQGLAIDASGNIWTASSFSGNVFEFSSSGALLSPLAGFDNPDPQSQYPIRLAIDSLGNAWVAASTHGGFNPSISKYSPSGVALSGVNGFLGGGLTDPTAIAIDGSDNVWVVNNYSVFGFFGPSGSVTEFSNNGTPLSPAGGFTGGGLASAMSIAIDNSGDLWVGNGQSISDICCQVSELSNSGTPISPTSPIGGDFKNGSTGAAYGIALDPSGNIWTANNTGTVSEFSGAGVPISPPGGYPLSQSVRQEPYAIAVDGAGNIWVADNLANSIVELSPAGSFLSSAVGFTNHYIAFPTDVAIDGSGNVWVADSGYDGVAEIIGAATPVITPLSAGVKNHAIATRP
jgi:streptogramin lyase